MNPKIKGVVALVVVAVAVAVIGYEQQTPQPFSTDEHFVFPERGEPLLRGECDEEVNGKPKCVEGELIVKTRGKTVAEVESLLGTMGAARTRGFTDDPELHLISYESTKSMDDMLEDLISFPDIVYAEPNYILYPIATPNDPKYPPTQNYQWAYNNQGQTVNGIAGTSGVDISAEGAWSYTTGRNNITVAIIDTGVDHTLGNDFDYTTVNASDPYSDNWSWNQQEYDARISSGSDDGADNDSNGFTDDYLGWNFVHSDNTVDDNCNHGAQIAGVIGAIGDNSTQLTGVAWTADMLPIKVVHCTVAGSLSGGTTGTTANLRDGIDYAVARGAKIINLSMVFLGHSATVESKINSNTNVLFIAGAGNDNNDNDSTPYYPASYSASHIIAVAATDQNDALATWTGSQASNYGATTVDLAAPGKNIYVPNYLGSYEYSQAGTSVATAFVSGVASLIWSQDTLMTVSEVKDSILNAVDTVSGLSGKVSTGGRLNAEAALAYSQDYVYVGEEESEGKDGGRCFVATAAYGSYLNPHVETLRYFRDKHLLTNTIGAAFVSTYYTYSPPLADIIAEYTALRWLAQTVLTPIIYMIVYPEWFVLAFACGLAGIAFRKRKRQQE